MTDKNMADKKKMIGEGHYDGDDLTFHEELGSFNNEPKPTRTLTPEQMERFEECMAALRRGEALPEPTPLSEASQSKTECADQSAADEG